MRPHTVATSTELLNGLRDARNQTVWAHYVARYRPLILAYCGRLGLEAAHAEDVAQESLLAFATAYRENAYDRARGTLRAWLFGVVRNTLNGWRRRRSRRREVQAPDSDERTEFFARVPDDDHLASLWEAEWRSAVIRQCMEELRHDVEPNTYAAFELFACRGWPAARVARHLGMSTNAVFVAKHRALRRLRQLQPRIEAVW